MMKHTNDNFAGKVAFVTGGGSGDRPSSGAGADVLNVPGSVKVTMEIPDESHAVADQRIDSGCAERMGDGGFLGPGRQKN